MGGALVWVAVAVAFAVGEISVAGTFFFLPFALGAGAAALTALLGVGLVGQVMVAVAASAVAAGLLIPYGRRLDRGSPREAIGATRWVGREALVLETIPAGAGTVGRIRVDREEWAAESLTGAPIPAGSTVLVSRVDGTRMIVLPLELHELGEGV